MLLRPVKWGAKCTAETNNKCSFCIEWSCGTLWSTPPQSEKTSHFYKSCPLIRNESCAFKIEKGHCNNHHFIKVPKLHATQYKSLNWAASYFRAAETRLRYLFSLNKSKIIKNNDDTRSKWRVYLGNICCCYDIHINWGTRWNKRNETTNLRRLIDNILEKKCFSKHNICLSI